MDWKTWGSWQRAQDIREITLTVAIYDRKTATVDATLASAVRKSVAQVDGGGAKKLKAAHAEVQAGMGG